MPILNQLSSQSGDRTETSNRRVAIRCLENPELLDEISMGLKDREAALVGDCAEVMTKVAEEQPGWVVPYADLLSTLLIHKNTRVRWEAMHALALITTATPTSISPLLPMLMDRIRTDTSVIVRDYASDAMANFASTGAAAAECAYPLLKEALTLWGGKQAGHALKGLAHVAAFVPRARTELRVIAEDYSRSDRGVVRKAAKELIKVLNTLG